MTNQHLTDETLQAFLFNEIEDEKVSHHLSTCTACSKKLESYQNLLIAFQKIAPESFAFDVTSVVMQKIVNYEKQEIRVQKIVFWGLLAFVILVVSLVSIQYIPQILNVFYAISMYKTLWIIGSGLFVGLFLLADLRRQYTLKERKIFENNLQPIL